MSSAAMSSEFRKLLLITAVISIMTYFPSVTDGCIPAAINVRNKLGITLGTLADVSTIYETKIRTEM
jgi:ABC-type xylose transport system permease subunit